MKWANSCKDSLFLLERVVQYEQTYISIIELDSIINNFPKEKIPDPDEFTDEFY